MPRDFEIRPYLQANRVGVKKMLLTEYNEAETMEMFKEEGREEAREEDRKAAEEKDRRRVWKLHECGMSMRDIAENMEIGIDTVQKWINGPKPAYV